MFARAAFGFGMLAGVIALSSGAKLIIEQARYFAQKESKKVKNGKSAEQLLNGSFVSLASNPKIPLLSQCNSINEKLKAFLQTHIDILSADSDIVKEVGAFAPNRLIISGPSGSGKSFFAKVFAKTLSAEYSEIIISDTKSKWAGEGVEKIKNVFERALIQAKKTLRTIFSYKQSQVLSAASRFLTLLSFGKRRIQGMTPNRTLCSMKATS